jgi:hypothetical protein
MINNEENEKELEEMNYYIDVFNVDADLDILTSNDKSHNEITQLYYIFLHIISNCFCKYHHE